MPLLKFQPSYLGLHFDRRLNWKAHITKKRKQTDLKAKEINLANREKIQSVYRKQATSLQSGDQTHLDFRNRTLGMCQQIQHSNHAESTIKNPQTITNAPWYVTIHTLHTELNIPYVSEVINERINKNLSKLESHPNPLVETLTQQTRNRRLKRRWNSDVHD